MSLQLNFLPPVAPVPEAAPSSFEKLTQAIDNHSCNHQMKLCAYPKHSDGVSMSYFSTSVTSQKMHNYARNLFDKLLSEAQQGKTSVTLRMHTMNLDDVMNFYVVARVFMQMLSLEGTLDQSIFNQQSDKHTVFCRLTKNPVEITISWKADNLYLNPKPVLQLTPSLSWGSERLNEERKKDATADLTLVVGQEKFSVHRLLLKSFSPYFEKLLGGGWKEKDASAIELNNRLNLSREMIEVVISYMYTRKFDRESLSTLQLIQLLEWSFELQAENLQAEIFNHLAAIGEKLTPQHILYLLFLHSNHSFPELKKLCDWFLSARPNFGEDLLKQTELSSEELQMLFAVARHYNIKKLREQLRNLWEGLSTEEKANHTTAALANGHTSLIKEVEKLGRKTMKVLQGDGSQGFIKIYEQIRKKVLEIQIASIEKRQVEAIKA